VKKTQAAAMLGVSVDFFDEHIACEVKSVRRGGLWLYRVCDLEAWLERETTLPEIPDPLRRVAQKRFRPRGAGAN
jgi:hypothetical protein